MNIEISDTARKQIKKLPQNIRKKFQKQILVLKANPGHPSLKTKKKSGSVYFEARIDYHYRFTFDWEKESAKIITVGPHDTGLGKK